LRASQRADVIKWVGVPPNEGAGVPNGVYFRVTEMVADRLESLRVYHNPAFIASAKSRACPPITTRRELQDGELRPDGTPVHQMVRKPGVHKSVRKRGSGSMRAGTFDLLVGPPSHPRSLGLMHYGHMKMAPGDVLMVVLVPPTFVD
jgi:hypothetical protein